MPSLIDGFDLVARSYQKIDGWESDDHGAALNAFLPGARKALEHTYKTRQTSVDIAQFQAIAQRALELGSFSSRQARAFFEDNFQPMEILQTGSSSGTFDGFVTGFFEPEVEASDRKSDEYSTPLFRRPKNLIDLDDDNRPISMDTSFRYGLLEDGSIKEHPDRDAIDKGVLDGQGLELFWLRNKIDAFFIHVQGSARLKLQDGTVKRVTYAAKSGHPYTSVAKILIASLGVTPESMTADRLADWMYAHPDELNDLLAQNQSYIFFKEEVGFDLNLGPIAAAKVPLIAGRSLAVDRAIHTFGLPFWVSTKLPLPDEVKPFRRLMMAHDTGSAIVGTTRGDLFIGTGKQAGLKAGRIRHDANMIMLMPK